MRPSTGDEPAPKEDEVQGALALAPDVTRPQRLGAWYQQMSREYASRQNPTRAQYNAQGSLAAIEAAANLRLTRQIYNRLGHA